MSDVKGEKIYKGKKVGTFQRTGQSLGERGIRKLKRTK